MADTAIQHHEAHEQRDVSRRGFLIFAAAFGALVVLSVAVLWILFGVHQGGFSAAQHLGQVPADSELGQRQQLATYMAAQKAELDRLGWTDGSRQYAKVPIDDAMRLLAAKGAAR
jgi:hypothetical protein